MSAMNSSNIALCHLGDFRAWVTLVGSMGRFGEGVLRRAYLGLGLKILFLDLVFMGWIISAKGDGIGAWLCIGLE